MTGVNFGIIDSIEKLDTSSVTLDEASSTLKSIQFLKTNGNKETIYTVTTGKTLYVTKMIGANPTGTGTNYKWHANGVIFASFLVAATTTHEIDFRDIPFIVTSGNLIEVESAVSNVFTIIGREL